jgi:hypothetical protein
MKPRRGSGNSDTPEAKAAMPGTPPHPIPPRRREHSYEIVEARLHHCGQMARMMRPQQRAAIIAAGFDPHRVMCERFRESSIRRAWLIDGRLAGIGGVTGTLLSPFGSVWVVPADWACREHPIALARVAARELDRIMQTHSEVATVLVGDDEPARRLAVFLGFHVGHDRARIGSNRDHRHAVIDRIASEPTLRIPIGDSYAIPLGYHESAT